MTTLKAKMIADADKIYEFQLSLEMWVEDDRLENIEALTEEQIYGEAKYILSTFDEKGHNNHDIRMGWTGDPDDIIKDLNKQYRALKRYVKKYKEAA
jgi:hypothetical protein